MGQTYLAVNPEKREVMSPHEYDNGGKLMEHGFIDNEFVAAVEVLLRPKHAWYKQPLVWAGDYGDADINLDDDGDYFTWTVEEAKAVLSDEEFQAAALHFDIEQTGEMHHDPAKNVLWIRALPEEVASHMGIDITKALDLLASAKTKMYAARLQRPTPFVDKTVYVNWNAMCVSAYLQAAQVLSLEDARDPNTRGEG